MKILVVGLNYAPEPVGIGPYTAGMCEALVAVGHSVAMVAAKPYYPYWRVESGFSGGYRRSTERGVDVTRCPIYVPAIPSGAKRLVHHASFAAAAAPIAAARARAMRPDVVIAIAPSLVAAPTARLAARIAGAPLWLHIQDFEVEAAFATGLIDATSRTARLARDFEARSLAADRVSSISPQMCAKLAEKGVPPDRIVEFRNWADIEAIRPLDATSAYRAEWGIDRPHVALYSGNIANKQGIEIVVDAARLLAHRNDLLFAVCGNGPNREWLEASAAGLDNIRFFDLQPKERLSDLLGLATVHLLPQIPAAADLVLPSKLANMLASGRPVVAAAAADTGLAAEVKGAGIVTPPGDAASFAAAIKRLVDDRYSREDFAREARARAEQRWSRGTILARFEYELSACTAETRRT